MFLAAEHFYQLHFTILRYIFGYLVLCTFCSSSTKFTKFHHHNINDNRWRV